MSDLQLVSYDTIIERLQRKHVFLLFITFAAGPGTRAIGARFSRITKHRCVHLHFPVNSLKWMTEWCFVVLSDDSNSTFLQMIAVCVHEIDLKNVTF